MTEEKMIDCAGLPCPQPVLKTKEALESMSDGVIEVIVDNEAAKSNVERFSMSQGCEVTVTAEKELYRLTVTKTSDSTPVAGTSAAEDYSCDIPSGEVVYVISSSTMGEGDEVLGQVLMRAFIKTIREVTAKPTTILFYNSGVHITSRDSDLVAPLIDLEKQGVKIYSCGTCLDFYDSKDNLLVGQTTNMFEIIESIANAGTVVRP